MHATTHPTITRRPARGAGLPPAANDTSRSLTTLTDDDIIDAIRQLALGVSTKFVMIAHVRVALGLRDDDGDWFKRRLKALDDAGLVMLSPIEKPQDLALYQAPWWVPNASGVHCHEITAAEPGSAARAAKRMTENLIELSRRSAGSGFNLAPLLSKAAAQSQPFRVKPAPMP